MSSITKKRPMWLTEQVDLWPRIQALWEHPNRTARLASGFRLASHERAESHMLATLILSYIDKNKEELPRICDLFTLFAHPVRAPFLYHVPDSLSLSISLPGIDKGPVLCTLDLFVCSKLLFRSGEP